MIEERTLAVNIIMDITSKRGYNNIVLKKSLSTATYLTRQQKAFVTDCVNGTLRRIIFIDYIINKVSKINTRQMDAFILNLFRTSVYQIMYMDKVPKWAVCDEAVKMTQNSQFKHLKGYVNGVIRNIIRNVDKIILDIENIREKDIVIYFEIKYSCPRFIIKRLIDYIGLDETENFFKFHENYRPDISLCVNTLKTTPEQLAKKLQNEGVKVSEGKFIKNALRIKNTSDITKIDSFNEGLFHIMDESAMLAPIIANPQENTTILDVCAAPGSKSFMSAYLTKDNGTIVARDVFPHKIKLIQDGVARLNLNSIKIELKDALQIDENLISYADIVIVDAPCTGFGLIGKKPDIKYGKSDKDISEMQALQRKILTVCQKYVKPNGSLVYCTCTLTPEENEKNVQWFLKSFPFESADISGLLPPKMKEDGKGFVRIIPHKWQADGFFIAKFTKLKDVNI